MTTPTPAPLPRPDQWQRIKQVMAAALDTPPHQRRALVDSLLPHDPDLRLEVQALLDADQQPATSLLTPHPTAHPTPTTPTHDHLAGYTIGPFRVQQLLGSGGMGSVYQALQDQPRRLVALKVIRAALLHHPHSPDTTHALSREGQLLARLSHPSIAQVYQTGSLDTPLGPLPWLALELIPNATPITDYAHHANLSTPDRLRLFLHVCDGVQHAHHHGIIHRDLKPSNILIPTAPNTPPIPKIIDFGIARSLTQDPLATLHTPSDHTPTSLAGTLAYLAPELLTHPHHAPDARADVYALGVLLFELLTAQLPLPLANLPLPDAARLITTQPPTSPASLCPDARGDLAIITLKTLEKDPERRYRSPAELADDLRRYLTGQPIAARAASTLYQLRMLARRHRPVAAGALIAALALLLGFAATALALRQALRDRDRATDARQRAEAITDLLLTSLRSSDPRAGGSQSATIADALDNALRSLDTGSLTNDPATEAALRAAIALVMINNGRLADAEPIAHRALQLCQSLPDPDPDLHFDALTSYASALQQLGKLTDAEPLFRTALALALQHHPEPHPRTARAHNNLAALVWELNRPDECEQHLNLAYHINKQLYPTDHPELATSIDNLATLATITDMAAAEPLYRDALAMRQRLYPTGHPELADSLANLAMALRVLRRPDEALPYAQQALDMRRALFAAPHHSIAHAINQLALVHLAQQRLDLAEPYLAQALAMREQLLPELHWDIAVSKNNLAACLLRLHRPADALPYLRSALRIWQAINDPLEAANTRLHLAAALADLDQPNDAKPLILDAQAFYNAQAPGDSEDNARSLTQLASITLDLNDPPAAASLARDAADMWQRLLPGDSLETAAALELTARAQLHSRATDPNAHSNALTTALTTAAAALGMLDRLNPQPPPHRRLAALCTLAHAHHLAGHRDQARAHLDQALDTIHQAAAERLPLPPKLLQRVHTLRDVLTTQPDTSP